MLRLHSKCTPNVIGGYIGGKVIQSLQFTQDVPTGFQGTLPPVTGSARYQGFGSTGPGVWVAYISRLCDFPNKEI